MSFNIKKGLIMGGIVFIAASVLLTFVAAIAAFISGNFYFLQNIPFFFITRLSIVSALASAIAFFVAGGFIDE